LFQKGFKLEYPNNRKFAVCLTHDVDEIYPPLKHIMLSSVHCLKYLNLKELKYQINWKLKDKRKSPYINFRKIMQLEEKYDAKSSFYFITANEDLRRFRYNIEDIDNELGYISDNHWEVGLHGGYYSYNDFEKISTEKKRLENVLGRKVIGFRNHYLRFKVPDSWELLSSAGFRYDTTFGYNDMIGFRNGMCHPFKPYNLNENREIDILEIPLVVMDATLFNVATSFEDAWGYTKKLVDIVEKYNGVITFLWHNNVFNCPFRQNWGRLYEKILKYCYEKNAWMTSGEEIYNWWSSQRLWGNYEEFR
jgi:peptidoglycan/xylan/chitin deacetylase (PgdA/CDA1 family)